MFGLIKQWMAACIMLLIGTQVLAAQYTAGKDYEVLAEPVPVLANGKIHVEEAFWYGCPHCFHLEEDLNKWVKSQPSDVEFSRVPAMFGRAWVSHAQLFHTAAVLDVLDQAHTPIFRAIHLQKKRLLGEDEQVAYLAELTGMDKDKISKAYNSFAVKSRMQQSDKRIRSFGIRGVPALIINGKYIVNSSTAGSQEGMLAVASWLIEQERSAE